MHNRVWAFEQGVERLLVIPRLWWVILWIFFLSREAMGGGLVICVLRIKGRSADLEIVDDMDGRRRLFFGLVNERVVWLHCSCPNFCALLSFSVHITILTAG